MDSPADPLVLRAGLLSLLFESGGLRYIRLGQREIVRRVYCAVRDANWGTVPDQITNLHTDVSENSFRIEFDVQNKQGEVDFAWHGTIIGDDTGQIVFEMDGAARSTFRRNRIGFCILHPLEVAGLPVEIQHPDGSTERSQFPRYIAPQNPFLDVVGLRHAIQPGLDVALTFEGDVFETEDQRNWIDASFKSFCTPLSQLFPVEVKAGQRIFQRVTLALRGSHPQVFSVPPAESERHVKLKLSSQPSGPLPQIGFAVSADADPLTPTQRERLRLLRPAHIRCELKLSNDFEPVLHRAMTTAADLDAALDLALFVGANPDRELNAFLEIADRLRPLISRWAVFPNTGWSTTRDLAESAVKNLRQPHPHIPLGGGTPASFTELNRNRPPIELLDFVTWSQQPQVHASDNASIIETLAAHAHVVDSARQFSGNLPFVVGPITFNIRVNPYATGPWPPPLAPGSLPPGVDPRQMSLFAAGWTLGSIKYLAESGVHAATYYETIGWKGLMKRESGSPLPNLFPSPPGCVFPMYHIFADLAEMPGAQVMPLHSSAPLSVEALALVRDSVHRVLLANLSAQTQTVVLSVSSESARIRLLDELCVTTAMLSPKDYRASAPIVHPTSNSELKLQLSPFAIACVDAHIRD